MKLLTGLPLALLAGRTLADCGRGLISGSDDYRNVKSGPACVLKSQNVYFCGGSGTSVVHKQSRIILRAGTSDSTVQVECVGGYSFLLNCDANTGAVFTEPACKDGISAVYSVIEPKA
ncbi:hypothetical protein E4U30_000308 [Claviceps sp. LM220 group G6]|nr:hypothetical protein E4U32_000158 [Claviceps aff. humidiphila group G2b]KAG6097781.1 hypothetical protein E4U30_000308 [Claviceps sp. LM220 group G6]KAG6101743.1 hypothetical protein E4U31_003548 [Claviceps sp. LM219 group G6]